MIVIRPATADDSRDLFDWRNDEATRFASVSTDPVSWADHSAWLTRALGDPSRSIYIAELVDPGGSSAVGMCRFDMEEPAGPAEVSINLNPAHRGRGLAAGVLRAAIDRFCADRGAHVPLAATIRRANVASMRIFQRTGFVPVSQDAEFEHLIRR